MEQTTGPGRIIYILDPTKYFIWSPIERLLVEEWLSLNGIDPKQVLVGQDASQISIRRTETGDEELSLWVCEVDENGKRAQCPHCPGCVRQTRVVQTPIGAPPLVNAGLWRESTS